MLIAIASIHFVRNLNLNDLQNKSQIFSTSNCVEIMNVYLYKVTLHRTSFSASFSAASNFEIFLMCRKNDCYLTNRMSLVKTTIWLISFRNRLIDILARAHRKNRLIG